MVVLSVSERRTVKKKLLTLYSMNRFWQNQRGGQLWCGRVPVLLSFMSRQNLVWMEGGFSAYF